MIQAQYEMKSPIGPLFLVTNEKGLLYVTWDRHPAPTVESLTGNSSAIKWLRETVKQLQEYFDGQRNVFDLPLIISGTPFQKSVWNALSGIPHGQTCSYKELAKAVSNPGAMRAVGTANGRNPIAIIIPCHRVIAADGTLGGYAGGLEAKAHLLALEFGPSDFATTRLQA
jgi:methylated-DNA-[protein]-cysteine S-methyltransferase